MAPARPVQSDSSTPCAGGAELIINPAAGSGGASRRVRQTSRAGDARRFAAEAVEAGVRRLILAGGDGTIHEAVNGLSCLEEVTLGIVPLGTGNDLARCLGLPLEIDAVLSVLEAGHAEPMDLIRATSVEDDAPTTLVVNAASGGFSNVLHRALSGDMKRVFGPLAYLLAAVNAFHKAPNYRVTITHDGRDFETDACAVMVCNGRYAAGGQELAPGARPDSSRAKLICVSAPGWRDRFGLLVRYYLGRYLRDRRVISHEVRRVSVASSGPMRFYADGEPLGKTPLSFEVLSGALRVIVPAEAGDQTTGPPGGGGPA
jgi:diacylglycerol kinase (ATP)